jgi:hypothetical protein
LTPKHDVEIEIQQEERFVFDAIGSYRLGDGEATQVEDAPNSLRDISLRGRQAD